MSKLMTDFLCHFTILLLGRTLAFNERLLVWKARTANHKKEDL